MIVKPSIYFLTQDGDPDLVVDVQKIITGMTGNAAFPKAVALLLLIKAALEEFITALANAGNGGTTLTAIKNDKRKALCALVRSLAGDVEEECLGDLTILLSSGFPIQKPEHYPIGDLPSPGAPTLTRGIHSGDLNASVAPVYGAATYNWQVAAADAPTVILQTDETTASDASFKDLPAGKVCVVRANAVGAAGTSDWSQSASLMVV